MMLPIAPLSQRDHRWSAQRLGTVNGITIGSHGCVITDMAMLATYYNHPILPDALDNILTDRNLYYDGDLFVNSSITKIFPDISFDSVVFCETNPAPIDKIKSYLNQGKPSVVALINYGIRHYILAVGYDGNRIFVNDPWQGDQVAINDRWGDPAVKILQVNFFSGPVPSVQPVSVPLSVPPFRPPVDPGGDDGGINIPAHLPVIDQPVVMPNTNIDFTAIQNAITAGFNDIKDQLLSVQTNPVQTKSVNQIFIDSLKSRKFILSLLASTVAFLNSKFNLGLSMDQLMVVVLPILSYVLVEGAADIAGRLKTPKI